MSLQECENMVNYLFNIKEVCTILGGRINKLLLDSHDSIFIILLLSVKQAN